MNELDLLRQRIVELEVAAREGLKTINWFESWLNGRDEPVRYDPVAIQQQPPKFTVNYNARDVASMKDFITSVLEGKTENEA